MTSRVASMRSSASQRGAPHYVQIETPKVLSAAAATPTTKLRDLNAPQLTLEWRELNLTVRERSQVSQQMQDKSLLTNVTGRARPGELLVVMGPSGAGKSTLLDCISGRNAAVTGSITVNGAPWTKRMQRFASYIHQDDIFYETITVREHLLFQARLRMGAAATDREHTERVDAVLEEFGLTRRCDSIIGGARIAGISGGERKRLSLASEMLTNPSIMFADEPTSGIDSFMAETIVQLLRRVAREGRTVVATIHQPSSQLFALFDQLLLLSDGHVVYSGPASAAVQYFASVGHQCPRNVNPSDFFMTQLVVIDKEQDPAGVERLRKLKDAWIANAITTEEVAAPVTDVSQGDVGESNDDSQTSGEKTDEVSGSSRSREVDDPLYYVNHLGLWSQVRVLAERNVSRILRDHLKSRTGICQSLFVAWLVGSLYFHLQVNNQRAIQNVTGMLFFIVINQTFTAAIPAFSSVPAELPLLLREYRGRLYHLLSWYVAKNLSEMPFQILLPVVFFVPTFFVTRVGHSFTAYLEMQVILILVNSAAIGMGYFISCLCRRGDIAPIVGVASILPFLLFGGLLINSDNVPVYYVWIQYISPIKYGFEGLMKVFWSHVGDIPCATTRCVARTGSEVLANYQMDSRSVLGDALLLLAINVAFRVLAFGALWRTVSKK